MSATDKKYEDLLLKNEKLSMESWLAKYGARNDNLLLDKSAEAKLTRALGSTDRGSLNEALTDSGLSGTGYEDYLKRLGEREYASDLKKAEGISYKLGYENSGGYQKYLSEYSKLQTKISDNFIKSFAEGGDFSEENAYQKAIESGLSRENALYSAVRAVRAAKDRAIEESIAFAKMNALTPYRALEYAKSLGLDEKEAGKVYDAVSTLSDDEKEFFSSLTPEEYYNYVKNRHN
jgi:hypothetical protein